MRANWRGVLAVASFTLLVGFYGWQQWIISVQPKREANPQHTSNRSGEIVRPESAEERTADYTEALARYTGALVAVTALLAIVSCVQIWFLIRADKTGRRAADAAKEAAEAARDQVVLARDTAEAPLRAYLSVADIFMHRDKGEVGVSIKNNGRTPAKLFVAHCWIDYNVGGTGHESSKDMLPEGIQIAPDATETFRATGFDPIPELDDLGDFDLPLKISSTEN
jgi:hypothetical protein